MKRTRDQLAALDWRTPRSSNVRRLVWVKSGEPVAERQELIETEDSEALGSLFVLFHSGAMYHYADVPETEALVVSMAESVSKALQARIKGTYDYEIVEIEEA